MKQIRLKCWVEDEGEKFYGPGPNELLRRIQKEGSLSRAAEQMHMSYKKAWDIVQRLNAHTKQPLVHLKKGGPHGGGAEVTQKAIEVMEEYERFEKEVSEIAERQNKLLESLK